MTEELKLVARPERDVSPTLRDLLSVLFRQRRLVTASFAATFLAIFLYGLVAPPYKSEMKVLLRRGRVDPVVAPTPSQSDLVHEAVTEEDLNSEVELLGDDEILRTVAENAGVAARSWLHPWDDREQHVVRAARKLKKRLTIEPLRKTNLINVTYKSSDAGEGVKVLHALAAAYLERHAQVHRVSGESGFFDQQLLKSRRGLEQAESQLIGFSRDQGVVSAAFERDAALRNLSDGEVDARQTQVSIAATSERIRMLRSKFGGLPERAVTVVKNSDKPELMEKMKSRQLELELNRTELLAMYEPTYRSVQDLDQEIVETRASIAREEQAPIREESSDRDANHEWVKSELLKSQVELSALKAHALAEDSLLQRDQEVARQLGERAIQQEQLLNDLKEAEQQYLLYANKREEARIGDALDQGGILNVMIAEQPTVPALPQLSAFSFAAIGLLAGAVISVGAGFANDRQNPAFRTPEEVLAYLGTPVLASLPRKNR